MSTVEPRGTVAAHYAGPFAALQHEPGGGRARYCNAPVRRAALLDALGGLNLGSYDIQIVDWMVGWNDSTVRTVVSWLERVRRLGAYEAGWALGERLQAVQAMTATEVRARPSVDGRDAPGHFRDEDVVPAAGSGTGVPEPAVTPTESTKGWWATVTLSTNVYVLDQVDAHEVFRFGQTLMTKYDEIGHHRPPSGQIWSDTADKVWRDGEWIVPSDGTWSVCNQLGQDLPAILDVSYRPGAPLRAEDEGHGEDCEEDCSGQYHDRACWVDVDFDTAYGYRDSEGRGCGDLHALLVAELGRWLDERGVRWEWRNEFTGEVHGGEDRYERLIELCSGGSEATAWYRTTVLPAIAAHIVDGG